MKNKRQKLSIFVLILALISLSACAKYDSSKGLAFHKKYKQKELEFGKLKRHGFNMKFDEEAFEGNEKLSLHVLKDDDAQVLEDPEFEFYYNPIELQYGDHDNTRLEQNAILSVKVPKKYYGTEFDASEMFFALYYDGQWEYIMPDSFDLSDKVARVEVSHFSFWGFGKPSEALQIETFAKHMATTQWERQNNKEKLYHLLGRQYEDLFESMGITDNTLKIELAHNAIEHLESSIYEEGSVLNKLSPMTHLITLAKGIQQGEGHQTFSNIVGNYAGQGLFEYMKLEPGFFSSIHGITGGLATAAGAISKGDTDGALAGIKEALHSNFLIKVSDNLLSYAKESGEYAIDIWSAAEIEKAYKVYIGEGSGKYGYHAGLEGDFNTIFTLLGGGQRQMEINIVKKYTQKYGIDEKELTHEMKKKIVDNAYQYLENSFKERKAKAPEIEKIKEKEKAFIELMRKEDFLKEYFHRDYFGMNTRNAKFDVNDRLRRLYEIRESVLKTIDPDEARIISDQELIMLMSQWIKFKERNDIDSFYQQLRKTGYLKQPSKLSPNYYWKLIDRKVMMYDNSQTTKVSLTEGQGNIQKTCINCSDLFDATTTWSVPNDTYKAGETITLHLSAKIDQYVWINTSEPYMHNGLNYVGTDVAASFDRYDLELGFATAGAIRLRNANDDYHAYVHTDYGEFEVEYQADDFFAIVPEGSQDGEKIGLFLSNSGIGTYVYIYEWTKG